MFHHLIVIPAQAGIQWAVKSLGSRFRGNDGCRIDRRLLDARRRRALVAGFASVVLASGAVGAQIPCRVLDSELAGPYQGGCKDGLADGYGEANGTAEYRGGFSAGRKHGKGIKIWPSGDRYEGDFVEDRKEGRGTYTWSSRGPSAGEKYTGAWLNDRRHGHGLYQWPSGDRYEGPWANDAVAGMPTPMMIARERAWRVAMDAIGKPGTKVCREITLGIATRDWIRGEVAAVESARVAVRIDHPGRHPHVMDGVPLVKGATLWSQPTDWVPCF